VLFGEPTAGVFRATSSAVQGEMQSSTLVSVVATTSVTAIVATFVWCRRHVWLSWRFERDDQLVAIFMMVLAANAVISYPYTKDVIMSPAGAFFAIAGFVAARNILAWLPGRVSPRLAILAVVGTALLSAAWAVRVIGTHVSLRRSAYAERNEWAYAEGSLANEGIVLTGRDAALFRQLRDDAIYGDPPPPPLRPPLVGLMGVD
jgi:hypothetical protein